MNIETELKFRIKENDYTISIVEADDLIAAWCYQKNNKLKRSYDFSRVPTEYRYSSPPPDVKVPLTPFHAALQSERVPPMDPKLLRKYSTTSGCHQPSRPDMSQIKSIDRLQSVDFAKRNVSPYLSPIMDTITLGKVVKDLGIACKFESRVINGRQYIVFGGYAGRRALLRGTVYSANNAKVVQMAIGALGIKNMVRIGAKITIVATVPLTIVQCIIEDKFTLANLIGRTTADLIKVGIGALAGGLAGLMVGAVTTTAVVPIAFAIAVSVGIGWILQRVDDHYGLTDSLVAALEKGQEAIAQKKEEVEKSIGRKLHDFERELIYRGTGYDIDNPFKSFR